MRLVIVAEVFPIRLEILPQDHVELARDFVSVHLPQLELDQVPDPALVPRIFQVDHHHRALVIDMRYKLRHRIAGKQSFPYNDIPRVIHVDITHPVVADKHNVAERQSDFFSVSLQSARDRIRQLRRSPLVAAYPVNHTRNCDHTNRH